MSEGKDQARQALVQLGARVDTHVDAVTRRHEDAIVCRAGCHACCQPGLTVGPAEADRLRAHLRAHPDVAAVAWRLERENPWRGTRCVFLDEQGRCVVYEARPLVCRAHGVPQQVRAEGEARRDVCELNFTGRELGHLESRDVLDLDTVHTVLAVIHARFEPDAHDTRVALGPSALLGE